MKSQSPPGGQGRADLHTFIACFLGWTLDAFDFFVVVFLVDVLAAQFHVTKADIIWTLTATLATRPLGAFLFGLLAERYGRRPLLMANILFFSLMELLCGFAPSFRIFLILRALYGIGMGGEWGVGASLVMETVKARRRGIVSGILQGGYPVGYILAAIAARWILPAWGWRGMFWVGAAPALLVFYILLKVPESGVWQSAIPPERRHAGAVLKTLFANLKTFAYLIVFMTVMMLFSHGSQDLYPDFLKTERHFSAATVSYLAVLYNIGAVAGAIFFGYLSERIGRRRGIITAVLLAVAVVPLWALTSSLPWVAVGAFLMQFGVQGSWGIVPAHLNEISPDTTRSLVPGLAYQFGILLAAPTNNIEYALGRWLGYGHGMALFEVVVIILGIFVVALGPEKRGKNFMEAS